MTLETPLETDRCPDCGTEHPGELGAFCENCGYNFPLGLSSGSPPAALSPQPSPPGRSEREQAAPSAESPLAEALTVEALAFKLEITVDASLWDATLSPPLPEGFASQMVPLKQAQVLIGRDHPSRAIHPAIALNFDSAVSHRHALLILQPDGTLLLRDLESSNGTYLAGLPLTPLADSPLQPGDSFTLGHWTRITIHSL